MRRPLAAVVALTSAGLLVQSLAFSPLVAHASPIRAPQVAPAVVLPEAKAKAKVGSLKLSISGLPKKTKAKIRVAGPSGTKSVTKSKTITKLKVGTYTITVSDLKKGKYWYRGVGQSTTKQVANAKTTRVKIKYTKSKTPTPAPPLPPNPGTDALKFDLTGAVGVALKASGSSTTGYSRRAGVSVSSTDTSGLLAVHADGTSTPAVTVGSLGASPTKVYTAPDGALVLQFTSPVDPGRGRVDFLNGCALLRIAAGSDHATCVDPALTSVPSWAAIGPGSINSQVQFDATGAVYYAGIAEPDRSFRGASISQAVFRRASGSSVVDLAPGLIPSGSGGTDFLSNLNFIVATDATVFFSDYVSGGGAPYLRRTTPDGGTTLLLTANIGFLRVFADSNVYIGTGGGVGRYLTAESRMDTQLWLGNDGTYSCVELAVAITGDQQANCPSLTYAPALVVTANGDAFGPINLSMSGGNWGRFGSGLLVRYHPEPKFFRSTVIKPATAVAAGNELIVAGTDASLNQRLIAFNTATETEHVLLDSSNEVDVYHAFYSASRQVLMFDGLRFADNSYVIGSINLASGAVQMSPGAKLSDFQGF